LGLTLIEAQKYARRAEQLAVLKTFAEGELLRRLPFRNLVGGSLSFPAETKLPRVGFRAVNEGYRQSYGVINSDSEFVHLFGGDLDVDRSIVDLQGPEARAAQTEMKVRSRMSCAIRRVIAARRLLAFLLPYPWGSLRRSFSTSVINTSSWSRNNGCA
jgi:hypothetical protein